MEVLSLQNHTQSSPFSCHYTICLDIQPSAINSLIYLSIHSVCHDEGWDFIFSWWLVVGLKTTSTHHVSNYLPNCFICANKYVSSEINGTSIHSN